MLNYDFYRDGYSPSNGVNANAVLDDLGLYFQSKISDR